MASDLKTLERNADLLTSSFYASEIHVRNLTYYVIFNTLSL